MTLRINHAKAVRYELMHGREATAALRRCPVGYLPVGCLERHGDHLPMGLDVLKAHRICEIVARAAGGVVFPPHFYSGIHGFSRKQLGKYTAGWGNIYTDASTRSSILDVIAQLEILGVKVLVLYSGHYPVCQVEMLDSIAKEASAGGRISVIPFCECHILSGDHAGTSETSLMLYLCRESVDMTRIGPRNYADHGWSAANDPQKASAAEGEREVALIVKHLTARIKRRIGARKGA